MFKNRFLLLCSLSMLSLFHFQAVMADSMQARCDIYPKGSDKASASIACDFSQRQGYISIYRADGVTHDLSPVGDAPGNYRDQDGGAVYRNAGLGDEGQIFRMPNESVYVYWDASGLAQNQDNGAIILALADQAMDLINGGDHIGLTDLMVPEAMVYIAHDMGGKVTYKVRTREAERNNPGTAKLHERVWNPTVLADSRVGMVWYPYDLYVNGQWSHCGTDIFNFLNTPDGWRIGSITFSALQPPDCEMHPDGPLQVSGGDRE